MRRTRTDRLGSPHARRRVSRSIQGRRPAQDKLGLSDESGLLPCCAARTCLVLAAFASSLYAPYENLMGLAGGLCAVPLAFSSHTQVAPEAEHLSSMSSSYTPAEERLSREDLKAKLRESRAEMRAMR